MSIYSKVQTSIARAFTGGLSDAVKDFTLYYVDIEKAAYNPTTGAVGEPAKTFVATKINSVDYVDGTCRGIFADLNNNDQEDQIVFDRSIQELIVLDSEVKSHDFISTRRYFAELASGLLYELTMPTRDPAGATVTFTAKQVQQ